MSIDIDTGFERDIIADEPAQRERQPVSILALTGSVAILALAAAVSQGVKRNSIPQALDQNTTDVTRSQGGEDEFNPEEAKRNREAEKREKQYNDIKNTFRDIINRVKKIPSKEAYYPPKKRKISDINTGIQKYDLYTNERYCPDTKTRGCEFPRDEIKIDHYPRTITLDNSEFRQVYTITEIEINLKTYKKIKSKSGGPKKLKLVSESHIRKYVEVEEGDGIGMGDLGPPEIEYKGHKAGLLEKKIKKLGRVIKKLHDKEERKKVLDEKAADENS